ncbi:alpha/beta hydrolase [Mycolicibacterium neoaurum]|uniref:Peptidase S15 n=1 Tax=Mycolicibacterium neoaurum TaxID=1795 RepID=A0AAV2WPX8_MYCNE|nr:alpha/beta hydrolase [Mycolicibacterium neoaurum]TLH58804.1 alpha/beta hydrolase [Mycolicibacterium neoaurum]CDQ46356.1 peptidase S15 [Mycolicibacterium neoaurum]
MAIQKLDVEFATEDGTLLRGRTYCPTESGSFPGIVMAHGFGGVQHLIEHYAELFAEAGFSVLLYDHRGFGISDGTPRQEVDPYQQMSDWRDAMTFALQQDKFDEAAGLGVWGSSFAGGLAIVLAAIDPRVRVVVAQIPNVSGHRNGTKLFTTAQISEIRDRSLDDRVNRIAGGAPDVVPLFTTEPDRLSALPVPTNEAFMEYIAALEANAAWPNFVTLRSVEHLLEFEPAGWIPYVSPKPLLMIIGENDDCTFPDVQREVFAEAGEPKKLVSHPGGHFDTYDKYFAVTGPPARDWFLEHLV